MRLEIMRLRQIRLRDHGPFCGEHAIEFALRGERPLTVIEGKNGVGKTWLLDAMKWCLYGILPRDKQNPIANKQALAEAEAGSRVESEVSMSLEHEGYRYEVRRVADTRAGRQGSWVLQGDHSSVLQIGSDGNAAQVTAPLLVINQMLPQDVHQYFLFDAEKIDELARPDHAAEVVDAIKKLLRIEALEQARAHFDVMAADFRRSARGRARGTRPRFCSSLMRKGRRRSIGLAKSTTSRKSNGRQSGCARLLTRTSSR